MRGCTKRRMSRSTAGHAAQERAARYSGRTSAPRASHNSERTAFGFAGGPSKLAGTLLLLPVMRPPSSLQIAVADAVDPRDMQAGSGVSGSLMRALEELAGRVVALDGGLAPRLGTAARLASAATRLRPGDLADLRGAVRRLHPATQLGRPTIAARWLRLRRELAQAGELDAVDPARVRNAHAGRTPRW